MRARCCKVLRGANASQQWLLSSAPPLLLSRPSAIEKRSTIYELLADPEDAAKLLACKVPGSDSGSDSIRQGLQIAPTRIAIDVGDGFETAGRAL